MDGVTECEEASRRCPTVVQGLDDLTNM